MISPSISAGDEVGCRHGTRAAGARVAVVALATAASSLLNACGQFTEALAMPNSRVMDLSTLSQSVRPGMAPDDIVARIGRPAFTFPVGWQKLSVWNYRFARPEGDCVVFQVSISNASGLVTETGQGPDPACDGPSRQ